MEPQDKLEIKEIKAGVNNLLKRPSDLGTLASILLIIATIGSVNSCNRTYELLERVQSPKLYEQNATGNEIVDRFYAIDGKRAYVEIDGKPVESYFPSYSSDRLER